MRLRATLAVATLILVIGCGDKENRENVADLQKKVTDLSTRVKSLEDQQLAADKKSIQQQQALLVMNERLRDQEAYIAKLQYGQSVTSR